MEIIGNIAVTAIGHVKSGLSSAPISVLRSPVLWGIAGVWVGVSLFFRGFPALKRKRLIQNIPTSTVRAASIGAVEVSGKGVGPYALISPLSESDGFYYRAIAHGASEEKGKTEDGGGDFVCSLLPG